MAQVIQTQGTGYQIGNLLGMLLGKNMSEKNAAKPWEELAKAEEEKIKKFSQNMDQPKQSAPVTPQPTTPQQPTGLLEPGNIDLTKRPVVKNPDGTISTVQSMGINMDGKELLIPTITPDGKVMNQDEAVNYYKQTGQHLGVFDTPQNSNTYAQSLHNQQDQMYSKTPAPAIETTPMPELDRGRFQAQYNVDKYKIAARMAKSGASDALIQQALRGQDDNFTDAWKKENIKYANKVFDYANKELPKIEDEQKRIASARQMLTNLKMTTGLDINVDQFVNDFKDKSTVTNLENYDGKAAYVVRDAKTMEVKNKVDLPEGYGVDAKFLKTFKLQEDQAAETKRHNQATESLTERGQNMTYESKQEALKAKENTRTVDPEAKKQYRDMMQRIADLPPAEREAQLRTPKLTDMLVDYAIKAGYGNQDDIMNDILVAGNGGEAMSADQLKRAKQRIFGQ